MSEDVSRRKGRQGLRKGPEEIVCVTLRLPFRPLRLIVDDEYETK